ncbi:YceI family protein [Pontibacter sp. H259]|uniref:YceI family protein n=1 Tax=Pontibacter sp. H259 TaxID=3133421 RepID=UPI0030C59E04
MLRYTQHLFMRWWAMLLAVLLAACDTSVKTEEAIVGAPVKQQPNSSVSEVYQIDTTRSTLTWIGAKITGRHNGVFEISSGELLLDKGKLTGGEINLNMLATRADDKTIDSAANQKLTSHLRSTDFFDAARYPTATFILTSVAPYDSTLQKTELPVGHPDAELRVKGATHLLTGNLTIKDKTKSIRFPAKITLQDSLLNVRANFNIDRTQWGLVYRSDKSLGNQTIHPEVNIGIDLEAKRTRP